MQYSTVFHYIGWMLTITATFMLLPALTAFVDSDLAMAQAFLLSALTTAFVGGALILAQKRSDRKSGPKEGVLFVILFWFVISFFGAFPIAVAQGFPTLLDAWFESVSGLTTTGASLITDYSAQPKALFLWRALLQWIGGFFTILTAAHILTRWGGFVLPVRRPKLPSFGHADNLSGVFTKIGLSIPAILIVYCSLTLVAVFGFWMGGIPDWEAICLALSSVASGGFSTRAGSISSFDAPIAQTIMMIVMILVPSISTFIGRD